MATLDFGFVLYLNSSEATSYRAAIRTAKGVVDDIGLASASKSGGLTELAMVSENHSERDGHHVIAKKFNLSLPLKTTTLMKAPGINYPGDLTVIRLKDWMTFIVRHNVIHMMVGLYNSDKDREGAILRKFWENYRVVQPNHMMWTLVDSGQLDTSRTIPLLLHGDEGRGRKRCPFLVLSWHSVLGFGTDLANKTRKFRPYLCQKLNYCESTHVHRMIGAALPKMHHDDLALQDLLQVMANDAIQMMEEGVLDDQGNRFHAVCLHAVGDWAWLQKAGRLQRTYNNCPKRPLKADSLPKGFCHLCRAGQKNIHWENYREYDPINPPVWYRTMHTEDPWNADFPSPLNQIPFVPGEKASFYAFDLFHSYHLGVGKSFVAAALALASERMLAGSVDDRLALLTEAYHRWCEEKHDKQYLSHISKASLGWPDSSTYPNGQWAKGHVTTALTNFFIDWVTTQDVPNDHLLALTKEAAESISNCLRKLYSSDVWLEKALANSIADDGLRFLNLYRKLSFRSFSAGRALFAHMPKGHAMAHVFYSLKVSAVRHHVSFSPLTVSVQADEDYIGKVSRLSRRTNATQAIKRVIERSLMASYKHWRSLGFLKE